jgi:hypothetical protein
MNSFGLFLLFVLLLNAQNSRANTSIEDQKLDKKIDLLNS